MISGLGGERLLYVLLQNKMNDSIKEIYMDMLGYGAYSDGIIVEEYGIYTKSGIYYINFIGPDYVCWSHYLGGDR